MTLTKIYPGIQIRQLLSGLLTPVLIVLLAIAPQRIHAYSVLSHEEVVDLAWKDQIVPLLLSRFPQATPEELDKAHAYAYGGCIIQDIGYYPFGSHFFSDLLHYVRTGDFVLSLLSESSDVNEYAFALGALAHYTADTYGHPTVNKATAEEYPNLSKKFGHIVTYFEAPAAHLQTEFGFDVVAVVHNRYPPDAYHNFIGFEVAKPLLERAFRDTYGFEVNQILNHEDLAIGTYRRSVSNLIPKMTRVAVVRFGKQIEKDNPNYDSRKLRYRISRAAYEKDWGKTYRKPGCGSRVLSFFLGLVPKVGPFKGLAMHLPNADTQQQFLHSLNNTVDHYDAFLTQLRQEPAYQTKLELPDRDLDTGADTTPGEYKLADFTYSRLLATIVKKPETPIPGALRARLLAFYAPGAHNHVTEKPKEWLTTQQNLELLRNAKLDVLKVSDQPTSTQEPAIPLD
ncbi:MAG TPA: zinc dependent phospholipase C family protein [Acidisarcina sp.]|nr:zinc dependent phospholipase C family protein [Acidisarcina sp.]